MKCACSADGTENFYISKKKSGLAFGDEQTDGLGKTLLQTFKASGCVAGVRTYKQRVYIMLCGANVFNLSSRGAQQVIGELLQPLTLAVFSLHILQRQPVLLGPPLFAEHPGRDKPGQETYM